MEQAAYDLQRMLTAWRHMQTLVWTPSLSGLEAMAICADLAPGKDRDLYDRWFVEYTKLRLTR